jgi:hypothetical protein
MNGIGNGRPIDLAVVGLVRRVAVCEDFGTLRFFARARCCGPRPALSVLGRREVLRSFGVCTQPAMIKPSGSSGLADSDTLGRRGEHLHARSGR